MNMERDNREIIREEPFMRSRILEFCAEEAHTVPEIAQEIGRPSHEAMFWVMGMRRYGWLRGCDACEAGARARRARRWSGPGR